MSQTLSRALVFVGLTMLTAAISGCHEENDKQHDAAIPVQVVSVQQSIVPETHHYSSDLQPAQLAMLRFRESGYITGLLLVRDPVSGQMRGLDVGDSVPQGSVLASLRKIDFATQVDAAQAQTEQSRHTAQSNADQLRQRQAQLDNDEANYIRAQHLYSAGAMTGKDFDQAKSQYESSLASRDSARKQLSASNDLTRSNEAQETSRRLDLRDSDLKAPFPGIVITKNVSIGDYASNMQDAFRFGDIRFVKAVFYVPANEITQLHLGDAVSLHLPQNLGVPLKGKITLVSSVADQQSRLFSVQVAIPNPEKNLLVGSTGTLDLKTGTNLQKLSVPFTALMAANADTHGYTVFVLNRDGDHMVTKLRKVYLVTVAGDRAIIDGNLQPGEHVIDRPGEQLRDGSLVTVQNGDAR